MSQKKAYGFDTQVIHAAQSPFHAGLTVLGLDTLALPMEPHLANAMEEARFLREHPQVRWVHFAGLEDHPDHDTARHPFAGKGFGGRVTFGLKDEATRLRFIDPLELVSNVANVGDCRTLVIHPCSSQYVFCDDLTREKLSVTPDMIRLSVGIEAAEDIREDLGQALSKA